MILNIYLKNSKISKIHKLSDRYEIFSSLKDEFIIKKDYLKANNIWNVFKMNTMGDYHDLYLKTDVLLLADVFEKFISTCLDYYGLDPCHYFSCPGLSYDAMLKMTGTKLELISDIDVHLFIEKAMRGGISYKRNKDIVKQIINTRSVMLVVKKVNTLLI